MRDAVFVICMGRSGSSALARILSLCGGALPLELLPPNYANATGYWEPVRAVHANESFLTRHGSSWFDPGLTMQNARIEAADRAKFVDEIVAILTEGFEANGPLVVKEPRISGLLPYWKSAARRADLIAKFIHLYRDPFEIASSLEDRYGLSFDHSFGLWLKYNLLAERFTRADARMFLSFDELFAEPFRSIQRCNAELGLHLRVRDETARAGVLEYVTLSPLRRRPSHRLRERVSPPLLDAALRVSELLHGERLGVRCPDAWDDAFGQYAGCASENFAVPDVRSGL